LGRIQRILWHGRSCRNGAEATRRQRGSPRRIGGYSGEQLRATKGKPGEIRGRVRSVTLREGSGTHERRPGHGVGTGRRRRSCGEAERGQVSMDREKQRGRERTEGCPGSRVTRQSSPRQQTRQGLDGDRRTGTRPRRTAVKLPRCAHRARERERGCSVGGTTKRGRASECGRAPEKAQACGSVVGKRAVVGASTVESAGGSGGGGRFRQAGPTGERVRANKLQC
jgi:hypothetical protein